MLEVRMYLKLAADSRFVGKIFVHKLVPDRTIECIPFKHFYREKPLKNAKNWFSNAVFSKKKSVFLPHFRSKGCAS